MASLCFDYGHGGSDPGAVYRGRKEKDDNLDIGRLVAKGLREKGVSVDETRRGDTSLSLKSRASFEGQKTYDYFISFHRNAFKPEEARGVETYIYVRGNKKAKGLATSIQKKLVAVGFVDRGVKESNFYVLRETKSPAILIELGFIDNTLDNQIFTREKQRIVDAISRAILDDLGIREKEKAQGKTESKKDNKKEIKKETKKEIKKEKEIYYRVMAGSFYSKANAQRRKEEIQAAGFEATIVSFEK